MVIVGHSMYNGLVQLRPGAFFTVSLHTTYALHLVIVYFDVNLSALPA